MAILEQNAGVMAWGRNTHGQLGIGKPFDQLFEPTRLKTFGQDSAIKQIACGEKHTVFLLNNGTVMTCGSNEFGQLGLFVESGFDDDDFTTEFNSPSLVDRGVMNNILFVAAGRNHTIAVKRRIGGDKEEEDQEEGKQDVAPKEQDDEEFEGDDKVITIDI